MKKILVLLILCVSLNSISHANENIRYYWSFGEIGVSWDNIANDRKVQSFLNIGNFNWITWTGLGFGMNLFNFEGSSDWSHTLLLPLEINYSPIRRSDGNPVLTFYGRGGLMNKFEKGSDKSFFERSEFFGAAGIRAAWFPLFGESWSMYTGAFIEYTSRNELRIGVSVDITIVGLIYIAAQSK